MSNVEASYNGARGNGSGDGILHYTGPKLTFKGDNYFNGNSRHGFQSIFAVIEIEVKGGVLNAFNNRKDGVHMTSSSSTLTVKKGGEVNACGNQQSDIVGSNGADQYLPASGKGFTCNTEKDTKGFECRNECPDCATAV